MFTADRLQDLSPTECWALLRGNQHHVGRVAFDEGSADPDGRWRPRLTILPVNYVLDVDQVVFRTAAGSKLDQAAAGATMAFAIDSVATTGPHPRHAWSVLARGTARVVTARDEAIYLSLSRLEPDAGGLRPHFVAVRVEEISGRRL